MINLSGYKIIKQIHKGFRSNVYRALREFDNVNVILKIKSNEKYTSDIIDKIKKEFDIGKKCLNPFCIEYIDIIRYENSLVIVQEDFNAVNLASIIPESGFDTTRFLKIAVQLAEGLHVIHDNDIIHKDIKPSNILYNEKTGQVKYSDFGFSTDLHREVADSISDTYLEGALFYISPEQTGRMNRMVDYRTDFYSLGITLYEMLTGKVPFSSDDAMKIIHAHIAKIPQPVNERKKDVPEVISEIIMKLLSKDTENRYQNSIGLMFDLEECRHQFEEKGTVDKFEVATRDISRKFQIPQKVYGRDKELNILMESFENVRNGQKEVVLVSGHPGIGKSVLINEIYNPIVRKRGYFLSGKYEKQRKNISYSAIIQAFTKFINQLSGESSQKIDIIKNKILDAVGNNGKIITDFIPQAKLIIGKQPDVLQLGPEETNNRINVVFENFLLSLTSKENPIVLFLDDLQWSDLASLQLIKGFILNQEINNILVIGSYRDSEVDEAHSLTKLIKEIQEQHVGINQINIDAIETEAISELIIDLFRCSHEKAKPLASIAHKKTAGNPFFINEFLKKLYDEKLVELDSMKGWMWNDDKINNMNVVDNLVDLLIEKINKFSDEEKQLLKILSCIGNSFDLDIVMDLFGKSVDDIMVSLNALINDGIINKTSSDKYFFHHDRIYEVTYSMLEEDEKVSYHYKIGKIILKNIANDQDYEDKLLYIAKHLNLGLELVSDVQEKEEIANINLRAGKKAKVRTSYESAFNYFKNGIELLGDDKWERLYDLTLSLYSEAAEAAFLIIDFEEMDTLIEIVLKKAKTILDKMKVYTVRILSLSAQNNLAENVDVGLSILELLGETFPKNPGKRHVSLGLMKTNLALRNKSMEDLKKIKDATDPTILSVMKIIFSVGSSMYITRPSLFALVVFRAVQLSLKHGISAESIYLMGAYSLLLCVLGDIDKGYDIGQLSLFLSERPYVKNQMARLPSLEAGFIHHWKFHIKESVEKALEGYHRGLEVGGIEFAMIGAQLYCQHLYYCGQPLEQVSEKCTIYRSAILKHNQRTYYNYTSIFHQAVLNFMGKSNDPCKLVGDAYNEIEMLPIHRSIGDGSAVCYYNVLKIMLNYTFENYKESIEYANPSKTNIDYLAGMFSVPIYYFYNSLSKIATLNNVSSAEKNRYLKEIKVNQKKLKNWSKFAPMNYLHKYHLVEAELAQYLGNSELAENSYINAIEGSRNNKFIYVEALSNELYAKYWMKKSGNYDKTKKHMADALFCYQEWGANAKVEHLKKKYVQYF